MVMLNKPVRLVQKQWLKGTREFELGEGPDLHVVIRDKSGVNEHHIDLREVKPQPTHLARRAWMSWIAGGLFAAGAVALILTGILSPTYSDGRLLGWAFGVPCLGVAILILRKAVLDGYDWLFFHHRFNGNTEIALFYGKPDPKSFGDFVSHLQTRIENAGLGATGLTAPAAGLSEQLQTLATLHTQGLLTAAEFESAKRKLLGTGPDERDLSKLGSSN